MFSLEHQYSPKLVLFNFTNLAKFHSKNVSLGIPAPYTTIIINIIQKDVDPPPTSDGVF